MTEALRNVLLVLQFDGSAYHGYQVQNNLPTIMKALQDAIEKVLFKRWDIVGCSRTDTGVHATRYCLSMKFCGNIPANRFIRSLNQFLPDDIAVIDAIEVPLSFHARYDCTSKEYIYLVHNSFSKDVFRPKQAYQYRYPKPIDAQWLDQQAQSFVGTHDFTSMCADQERTEDMERTISSFSVTRQGEEVRFTVRGDGFLYNMVRIMVGTLLEISMGRLAANSLPDILQAKDRLQAGFTAPACGLYLSDVTYPKEVFLWDE